MANSNPNLSNHIFWVFGELINLIGILLSVFSFVAFLIKINFDSFSYYQYLFLFALLYSCDYMVSNINLISTKTQKKKRSLLIKQPESTYIRKGRFLFLFVILSFASSLLHPWPLLQSNKVTQLTLLSSIFNFTSLFFRLLCYKVSSFSLKV